ncbi:MAG TPA: DUF6285 domain-containing protein [Stellaceae bacterium]
MRDRPDAASLLDFARIALLRDLTPLLPAERQYEATLIARAMAVAAREAAAGAAPLAVCHAALAELYGEGDLDTLLRRLAAAIRAGDYDAPGAPRDQVKRLLWAITLQKLSESNPDYLAASGVRQATQNGSA